MRLLSKAESPWWKGKGDWHLAVTWERNSKGMKVQKVEKMDFNALKKKKGTTEIGDVM